MQEGTDAPNGTLTLELAEARRAGFLNIGEAASRSGVSAKMIRHYESQGLIKDDAPHRGGLPALRHAADVHTLQFVRRARRLGFSMKEVAHLLGLWQNRRRSSGDVRRIAQRHIGELEQKIDELESMKRTLEGPGSPLPRRSASRLSDPRGFGQPRRRRGAAQRRARPKGGSGASMISKI